MTLATTLREIAAELREHPERWVQNAPSLDAQGNKTNCADAESVCWCAWGFVQRSRVLRVSCVDRILDDLTGGNVISWNDTPGRTAAEVAELFDKAAAKAESP
jgi:hypothetical protein